MGYKGLLAYACTVGQIANPGDTYTLNFTNFILADNGRAVTLRFGLEDSNKSAYLSDSYITALSRPNCNYCYGLAAIKCQDNVAVRMLTTTVFG